MTNSNQINEAIKAYCDGKKRFDMDALVEFVYDGLNITDAERIVMTKKYLRTISTTFANHNGYAAIKKANKDGTHIFVDIDSCEDINELSEMLASAERTLEGYQHRIARIKKKRNAIAHQLMIMPDKEGNLIIIDPDGMAI